MSRRLSNYLKNRNIIFNMSIVALFGAVSIVVTAYCAIPIASGSGYFNFSDLFTFVVASLVNPFLGGLVGGVSGLIADLIAGYGSYAPFTLMIKFIMGVVSGYLFRLFMKWGKPTKVHLTWKSLVSFIIGGLLMAVLYMFTDLILYKEFALINVGFNVLQGTLNAIMGSIIFVALYAVKDVIIKKPTSERIGEKKEEENGNNQD